MYRCTSRLVLSATSALVAGAALAGPAAASTPPPTDVPPAPGQVDLYLADPQGPGRVATSAVANVSEGGATVLLCDTAETADGAIPYRVVVDFEPPSEGTNLVWLTGSPEGGERVRFGRATDEPLCGSWGLDDEGAARDTFAVRRGNQFFLSSEPASAAGGRADVSFRFGRASDQALVGDWDGDGVDTVAVRRGNTVFFAAENVDGGGAVVSSGYGRASDLAVAGDFTDEGRDTVALRRGNTYFVSTGDPGERLSTVLTFAYGRASDLPVAGAPVRGEGDYLGVLRVRPLS